MALYFFLESEFNSGISSLEYFFTIAQPLSQIVVLEPVCVVLTVRDGSTRAAPSLEGWAGNADGLIADDPVRVHRLEKEAKIFTKCRIDREIVLVISQHINIETHRMIQIDQELIHLVKVSELSLRAGLLSLCSGNIDIDGDLDEGCVCHNSKLNLA